MWVDNCQLFLLQGPINPRKLEGGPSCKSPVTQLAFFFFLFVRSIIPSWFFSDRVECDIRQRPSMWEGIHGPNMNICLLAIFEYKLPDRIIFECVFAQLPYLIRIPKVTLAELESGGKWFHHSYNRRRNPDKAQVSKDEEDKPIYSLHVGLSTWGYISGCTYVY